jgi:hypothetical protein
MTDDKMLRISRYLTRARELETDPAKMKQDRVARLIGHLAGQRHELEEILKRLIEAHHPSGQYCILCRDARVALAEVQQENKEYWAQFSEPHAAAHLCMGCACSEQANLSP